jgi:hypothetical protein
VVAGQLPIRKLVSSRVMGELMDLSLMPSPDKDEQDLDASTAYLHQQRAHNWFSLDNALRIYHTVGETQKSPQAGMGVCGGPERLPP